MTLHTRVFLYSFLMFGCLFLMAMIPTFLTFFLATVVTSSLLFSMVYNILIDSEVVGDYQVPKE